ncbi:MAG: hypothetical protein V1913_00555 [Fibrobacterota bacterium]
MESVNKETGLSYKRLCEAMRVPYPTFKRWRKRKALASPVVHAPGPKKVAPFDADALSGDVLCLAHGRQRTQGTGHLYESWSRHVSRRDLDELVRQTRAELHSVERMTQTRLEWQKCSIGLVWATDGTKFGPSLEGSPLHLLDTTDLGSKHTFDPLSTAWEPCGEEVGGYVQHLFSRNGVPLFFKKDNGSNLNSRIVRDVLLENWVIPLNSPVRYPQYNGSLENNNGRLKKAIMAELSPYDTCRTDTFPLYSKVAAYNLNHEVRDVLGGRTACTAYHEGRRNAEYNITERRAIYDWIKEVAGCIFAQVGEEGQKAKDTAWRRAVETWLVLNGFVKTNINGLSVNLFSA